MKALASLVFVIAACPLFADPIITTSVSCQSYGAQTITAVSTCEQGGPLNQQGTSPSYAFASAEASVTLQTQATDWLTISMKNTVNPVDGAAWMEEHDTLPPNYISAPAFASASVYVHIDSYTLGPVRPGILQIQWTPNWLVSYGDVQATAGYSIQDPLLYNGALTGSCGGAFANCTGPGVHAPPIPFQLGTDFAFDSYATLNASSLDGIGSGLDGLLLQFRFYESDGVTPVLSLNPPTSAPEPASWALTAFATLGIVIGANGAIKKSLRAFENPHSHKQ